MHLCSAALLSLKLRLNQAQRELYTVFVSFRDVFLSQADESDHIQTAIRRKRTFSDLNQYEQLEGRCYK